MLQHCLVHAMAFAERPGSVQRSKLAGIALVSVGATSANEIVYILCLVQGPATPCWPTGWASLSRLCSGFKRP
jgi:hypothetical protein